MRLWAEIISVFMCPSKKVLLFEDARKVSSKFYQFRYNRNQASGTVQQFNRTIPYVITSSMLSSGTNASED